MYLGCKGTILLKNVKFLKLFVISDDCCIFAASLVLYERLSEVKITESYRHYEQRK